MFKRVSYDDWVVIIGIISFVIVVAGYLIGVIRAFCMPRKKREHLAGLPLEAKSPDPSSTHDSTSVPTKP